MALTEYQLNKLFNTFLTPDGLGGFKVKVDFTGIGESYNSAEATQLLVKAAVQEIAAKDFATETTLSAFLKANHIDLSALVSKDIAIQTTLSALQVALNSFISTNHDDLSEIAGNNFETVTTLQAFLTANHNDLTTFINTYHTDLGLILSKLISNPATETTLAALLSSNHIDLLGIKSSIDALGIEHTTYSVVIRSLVIPSTATDFIAISGSATKTIRINEIQFSGTATPEQVKDLILLKRKTLNTGGASTLCSPVALDSNSPLSTAVIKAYTINPTVLGTLIGEVRVGKYQFNSSNSLPDVIEYKFNQNKNQHLTLRGINEMVSLNLNGQTVNGANGDCYIEFDEY